MTIQIEFDAPVQEKAGGPPELTVTAATAREALYEVSRRHPALRLFNCEGEMRSVFHVRRGGAPIALDAPLEKGDTLLLSLG